MSSNTTYRDAGNVAMTATRQKIRKQQTISKEEHNWIVWLVIFLVIALLVYIGYAAGLAVNDYPEKDSKWGWVLTMVLASLITFLISGGLMVWGRMPTVSSIVLFISIMLDVITLMMVGTSKVVTDETGNTINKMDSALSYVVISPIIYKMFLFGYLTYIAGVAAGNAGKTLGDVFGQKQFGSLQTRGDRGIGMARARFGRNKTL